LSTLRDTYQPGDASQEIAGEKHATWLDAVAGYLARRRRILMQGVTTKPSFDAERIRERLKVLVEVGQTLGAEIGAVDPAAEETIARTPQMSREDHQVALSYLLTPLNWRSTRRPAIERRRQLALAEWEADTDSNKNLALAAELEELLAFLDAVETDARLVTGQRNRTALVGSHPLSPDMVPRNAM